MRVGIVGGGPAGLYLALLLRRRRPDAAVTVVEQNPAGATYGWGVVFSDRALGFLREADPESYADVEADLLTWDDQVIVHRGERVVVDGVGFSGIARLRLLQILQAHCRRAGVRLGFRRRLADPAAWADCDLLVGADGVRSVVRDAGREHFRPTVERLGNRYAWYGTARPFAALTLTFRRHGGGVFVAHHYPYAPDRSTFIVECDAATWEQAGLATMTEPDRRRHCETVFRDELGGSPLLARRARWRRFVVVRNRRWHHGRTVLIGDALRTVHFSIGSGTRTALEDAIALARALGATDDVPAALDAFERARRPAAEDLLAVADRSAAWYERVRDHLSLAPLPFAHGYLTRGGRITPGRLAERSPRFAAAHAAHLAAGSGPGVRPG